jgi:ribosome-binding factor A
MSIRTERVASLIKEEIGSILEREYRGPSYGFMTVTEVKMSPDLRIAKVSVSVFGDGQAKENAMKMLEEEKTHMRGVLGSHLRLKFTPMLQFYLDDTMERVDRINTLLRKIHENDGDKGTRS